jgi:predicted DNA-binding ribbon-helix-helix protein
MAEFYDSGVMREVARWDARMASVNGKATSISVEPRIWDYFCIIAADRGVTIGQQLSLLIARCAWSPLGAASAAAPRQSVFSSSSSAIRTGYGNGCYPVQVRRNAEGAELRVTFIDPDEEGDDPRLLPVARCPTTKARSRPSARS